MKNTRHRIDITKVFDKSGYTPLLYAAYKNISKACEIIIEFLLSDEEDTSQSEEDYLTHRKLNGGSGESGDIAHRQLKRKESVSNYINLNSRGEDGFTSLHFASFHGNIKLIRFLV